MAGFLKANHMCLSLYLHTHMHLQVTAEGAVCGEGGAVMLETMSICQLATPGELVRETDTALSEGLPVQALGLNLNVC